MIENRRSYRVPFRTKFVFGTQDKVYAGNSMNISTGGIFINCLDTLPRGTQCKILFQLEPGEAPVTMGAIVKRITQSSTDPEQVPGIALQFTPYNDQHESIQNRINIFMDEIHKKFEVAATILSSGEPDLSSLASFISSMHLPPFNDLGELKLHIERILRAIELVEANLSRESF